jgi:hypothetical protein
MVYEFCRIEGSKRIMEEYLLKQKELVVIAQTEAAKIATELISKCDGKTTSYLRKITLDYIRENQLPEEISFKVKNMVDEFITNIKIPTQE